VCCTGVPAQHRATGTTRKLPLGQWRLREKKQIASAMLVLNWKRVGAWRSSNCNLAKALPVGYTWNICNRTPGPKAFFLSFAKRPTRCEQIPLALTSTSGSSAGARFEVHVNQRRSGSSIASDLSFATMNR
jgi:hypothetical protein